MEADRKGIQLIETRWTGKEIETRIAWMLEVPAEQPSEELLIKVTKGLKGRPKGVWVGIDQEPHEEWECSNCGNIINTYLQDELEEHEYCHKCGTKMSTPRVGKGDEGGEEEWQKS